MAHLERFNTIDTARGDIETGFADTINKHFSRHVIQRKPITQRRLDFEHRRPRWLRECMAEATGVFFYVYPGISSTASFTLANFNAQAPGPPTLYSANATSFGSLLQIGLAFGLGIAFAIIVCAPTSGGHFNPAITLNFAFWQGFPWRKVPYYIFSQIFGAFVAASLVYGQYYPEIQAFSQKSVAAGLGNVYNGGPASIFMSLPNANQTNLGYVFLNEFFVDSFIGMVIWACLDQANPFIAPTTAPFAIGLVYSIMIWGFADITITTNLARDLGTRCLAAAVYGGEVFSYYTYSPLGILTNVPATFFGVAYYELVMRDSLQKIGKGAAVHEGGESALKLHLTKTGVMEEGMTNAVGNGDSYGNGKEMS